MRIIPVLAFVLAASIAHAQTPTFDDVVIGAVPTDAGGFVPLLSDIYLPSGAVAPTPAVLYIHGGSWATGDQNFAPFMIMELLNSGVAVATVGYRYSTQAIFPAQLHDVKGVVRYLRANATTYNIDPARIACWGSSAGAHLGSLLATTHDIDWLEGKSGGNLDYSSAVVAAVNYYPLTDLLNLSLDFTTPPGSIFDHDGPSAAESVLIGFSGPGEGVGVLRANQFNPLPPFPEKMGLITLANPATHYTADDPPMFTVHGYLDPVVPFAQSAKLHAAGLAAGSSSVLKVESISGHGSLYASTYAASRAFLLEVFFGGNFPVGVPFCFGDGSAAACPCGNASATTVYEGCLNSTGAGGRFRAQGTPSITLDRLVLSGSGMPYSFGLYAVGSLDANEGMGAVFGGGLQCIGGTIQRLSVKLNVQGQSRYPEPGDVPLSVLGGMTSGSTAYFQLYYRDDPAFCASASFNLTNGQAVTFVP